MSNIRKEDIIKEILSLTEEDFVTVMGTIAKENPFPNQASYITNTFQRYRKKAKGNSPSANSKKSEDLVLFQRPQEPKSKPGRDGASRAMGSSPFASLLPDIPAASAWQVPFIFRGDLVPKAGKLFMDVEKLSMKLGWGSVTSTNKHKQVGNNVAIVDEKGTLVFWAFIRRDSTKICQYFTSIHRINRAKVLGGVEIETVRDVLDKCIKGNILVGSKICDDLSSLSTENEFTKDQPLTHSPVVDIQDFFIDEEGRPINLKDLVAHFFPEKAKDFKKGTHSAISDARMTLQLFLKMEQLKSQNSGMADTRDLGIKRSNTKKTFGKFEKCQCNK